MRDCGTKVSCLNLELNENFLGQNQHTRQIKEIKYLDMYSWNNRRLRGLAFNQSLEWVVLWSKCNTQSLHTEQIWLRYVQEDSLTHS